MKKNMMILFAFVIVICILGGGVYFWLGNNQATPTVTTEPNEQIKIGDEESGMNENGDKSLVVYFSVPETDDPTKNMTPEEENCTVIVDGKVLGNTQYIAMLIQEYTNADIYWIEPEASYTTNHEDLVD